MNEKQFCQKCEYYYSEMFTCPICYGEAKATERIIKLLEPLFDKAENAETRRLLIMAIALIKGETVQEPSVSTDDGQTEIMDKGETE